MPLFQLFLSGELSRGGSDGLPVGGSIASHKGKTRSDLMGASSDYYQTPITIKGNTGGVLSCGTLILPSFALAAHHERGKHTSQVRPCLARLAAGADPDEHRARCSGRTKSLDHIRDLLHGDRRRQESVSGSLPARRQGPVDEGAGGSVAQWRGRYARPQLQGCPDGAAAGLRDRGRAGEGGPGRFAHCEEG